MAESTLSETLTKLQGEVGRLWGFGRGVTYGEPIWTAAQLAMITDCIDEGYRQFTTPPLLPNETNTYDWSFMKPMATLTLGAGNMQVTLPDDFGGIEGPIALSDASGDWLLSANVGNPETIIAKQNEFATSTGPPIEFGVIWNYGTSDVAGQRASLVCFPAADQRYTLQVQYYVLQNALSGAMPYPWGGMLHASAILASCLAVAEMKMNGQPGGWAMKFMERLQASVSADRRMKPQTGGYNGDRSDCRGGVNDIRYLNLGSAIVTYNGPGTPPFGA